MSSHSVETLLEPVFGRRMPSFSHSVAPDELPQPPSVSRLVGKPYAGAYFSFRPSGKDVSSFAAPWSGTESPDTHSPQAPDTQHIYRRESRSHESHPGCTDSAGKPGFTVYRKSPGLSGPQNTASVIVRKGPAGAESVSSDRPVYLSVPQAVYRHSPCCSDMCCVLGPPWKHRDTGEPQRPGPSDAAYGPGQTLPAVLHQTYGSTSVKEVSQSLECSPRAYPRLYPSHAAYEPLIYHSAAPVTKYGHAPQHPLFYYSPGSVELERTETQNPGPVHAEEVHKHPRPPPGTHYMFPAPLHADVSLRRREVLPGPAFLPGPDFPGYVVPRLNINTSLSHGHRLPRSAHSDFADSSRQPVQRPVATLASGFRDASTRHMAHSSAIVRVEQMSPTTCVKKSAAASGSQPHNRYGPPKSGVYVNPHGGRAHPPLPPHIQAAAQLHLDVHSSRYPIYRAYPNHVSPPPNTIASNKTKAQKILYCPPLQTLTKPGAAPQPPYAHRGKRAMSTSSPVKITDDDDDVYVVEPATKRQKTDLRTAEVKSTDLSSPMPVINNVFSLAPYQTYLHMSRLLLGTLNQEPAHCTPDQNRTEELKTENVKPHFVVLKSPKAPHRHAEPARHVKELKSDSKFTKREEIQPFSGNVKLTTLLSEVKVKQESPDEPAHVRAAVPKVPPSDVPKVKLRRNSKSKTVFKKEQEEAADRSSCSDISEFPEQLKIIKKEPEEIDPPDAETRMEIKKCEPDADHDEDGNRRSGRDFGQRNGGAPTHGSPPPPRPTHPPLPLSASPHPERVNFLNIPPHCLKLSTYNIILPDVHLTRVARKHAPSPERPNANQPTAPDVPPQTPQTPDPPPQTPQTPVRKHFFELHQSLVKLISKSVAAASEDSLRSWLSEMELSHVPSSKNQRVARLFGTKGTDACLNEEMKSSLQEVYQRLNEYSQECCPFPFVTRAGAVFLPMLVVKEVLFPSVHGALVDQVLQEHKVELRPTTLSEEKVLIQMNKRACSSRLRRLMSYKHLPAVYGDVVNLLYYTCVCKHLESGSCGVESSVQD
ncbi:hypothetical protein NL108_015066 [Boleophthalmus pectinirostris]|nr:hypothetical protein NL108_015066 [Boleophthalmus pectinirostris]